MEKLEKLISTYENYPKAGVSFKDVIEIVQHPSIFRQLILEMAKSKIIKEAEALISIDARGFIFGSAISIQAAKPMIVARKPGKLPGELVTKKYSLEYGENSLSIQKKALKKYNSFAIIDDLLATGGTVNCVSELINNNNKKVVGLLVVAELSKFDGRSRFNFPVESSILF
ncbi:Adenine phosphoribosyltransferase [Prochlorococcus marinus str. MIT 9312]|uniref:Adenine phosphoribosyltransferase n=1 Tax=Prochlorococcus marinus (strain MIT 9312) TaxID=74546 RepID=APT_PROM9|nr:adenine phosphoribosyltransferase [Prochlorococcus marinus]Q31AA3.1 RecName: Full=Adenine phosphoribosyltransferase; Short=APRT [Prochlorococcus marinus str. MIT 9312]ABB50192.1 Adenine phosphoribosyltransferase [Prochlorococcus marinus str. MIT 9312]KGG00012.1 Adenine phosphoribosyltransferase [Prochlorococcus marinus str. MIT 9311]